MSLMQISLTTRINSRFNTILRRPLMFIFKRLQLRTCRGFHRVRHVFNNMTSLHIKRQALRPIKANFTLQRVSTRRFLCRPQVPRQRARIRMDNNRLHVRRQHQRTTNRTRRRFRIFTTHIRSFSRNQIFRRHNRQLPIVSNRQVGRMDTCAVTGLRRTNGQMGDISPRRFNIRNGR